MRYVHLPAAEVDRGLLEDASRRGESLSILSFLFEAGRGGVYMCVCVCGNWERAICGSVG